MAKRNDVFYVASLFRNRQEVKYGSMTQIDVSKMYKRESNAKKFAQNSSRLYYGMFEELTAVIKKYWFDENNELHTEVVSIYQV